MSRIGHNSEGRVDGDARQQLRSIVERVLKLREARRAVNDDIRDVMAEAKGGGFDTKVLRKLIADQERSKAERDEEAATREIYEAALEDLFG